jgi:uncharacterized membrane protein
MENQNYSLFDVIRLLIKWKKLIIFTVLTATVISIIVSLLLPVYYRSTSIFYGYNLRGFDPRNLIAEEPLDIFGGEEDTERLLSIGKSSGLENMIIKKFHLKERYKIDSTEKLSNTKVVETFRSNYKIVKNERGAIEISVLDQDPQIAADMANEIVSIMDKINKQPVIDNNIKLFNVFKKQLDTKYSELDSLSQSVIALRKNPGTTNQQRTIQQYFEILKEVDIRLTTDLAETIKIKEGYDRVDALLQSDLKSIYIIEPAGPSEKKATPIRWLIVVSSTLGTFLFMVIFVILLELYLSEFGQYKKNAH